MSDEGNEPTPQAPVDENPKIDPTKLFSKAYNEGSSAVESRYVKRFNELTGASTESPEEIFNWIKDSSSKLASAVADPTQTDEYKELQNRLKDINSKYEEAINEATTVKNQYKFDSIWNKQLNELKQDSDLTIAPEDLEILYKSRRQAEFTDNGIILKSGNERLLDEQGNPKRLEDDIKEFAKPYLKANVNGTGGGSGGGGGAKPKFADFKANINTNREKAGELLNQAKIAGGWAEPDAPKV